MVKHTLGCIALLVTCGCGRKIVEEPPRTVVQARVQPCTEHCEVKFSPCGTGPSPAFDTLERCIEECSTVEGVFARFWAYQPDLQADACFDEHVARNECMDDLIRQCAIDPYGGSGPCGLHMWALSDCLHQHREGVR
jgi:hypothetical protein